MVQQATVGGPGHAELHPSGVGISPTGEIIVADTGNDRIRLYSRDGTLLWTAGESGHGVGQFNEPRDADSDSQGNIYITDQQNARVVKLGPDGRWIKSWNGPATNPLKSGPMGIAVRSGKVYLAESGQQRVRVWNLDLDQQLTVYDKDSGCVFRDVRDMDVDSSGKIYISNYPADEVLVLDPNGRCISQWNANTYGIRVEPDSLLGRDLVYIGVNSGIGVYDTDGRLLDVIGTRGNMVTNWSDPAGDIVPGTFQGLRFFTVDSHSDVWAGDLHGYQVEHFSRTRTGWKFAGAVPDPIGPPLLEDNAAFNKVRDVAFGADGTIHGVDYYTNRIVRFDANGTVINACGNRGTMGWPKGVAVDQATGNIWFPAGLMSRISIIRPDCSSVANILGQDSGLGSFRNALAIAIRQSDRIAFVADTGNSRIVVYDVASRKAIGTSGSFGAATNQFHAPRGIAVDAATGRVWVADTGNNRVVELSFDGTSLSWVREIQAGFNQPQGIARDRAGRIFVADSMNNRVVVLNKNATVIDTVEGLAEPASVAVNDDDGRIFVSDQYRDTIRVFSMTQVDPCGAPTIDRAKDSGLYLWVNNCGTATRNFTVRALAGGSPNPITYVGQVGSDAALRGAAGFSLESNDRLQVLDGGLQLRYQLNVRQPYQDGFSFNATAAANVCFGMDLPAGTPVRVGPNATPVIAPFDLTTFKPCSAPPRADLCGAPTYDPASDSGLYLWEQDCDSASRDYSVRSVAGGATRAITYAGTLNADQVFGAVTPVSLESSDLLDVLNGGTQIEYRMQVVSPWSDGFDFNTVSPAGVCFGADLPAGTDVLVGPSATPIPAPFDLVRLLPCQ